MEIGVDRITAFRLYTTVPTQWLLSETGHDPRAEKLIVNGFFFGAFAALMYSIWISATAFGWWNVLIIPIALFVFVGSAGVASAGTVSAKGLLLFLVGAIGVHFFGIISNVSISSYAVFFMLSLWMYRMSYIAATGFFRQLIVNNSNAFRIFEADIVVREVPTI